jgi:hypothetical protein
MKSSPVRKTTFLLAFLPSLTCTPAEAPAQPVTVVASSTPANSSQQNQEQEPAARVAREFWTQLARRNHAGAVTLSTYPFDLDAHPGCVSSPDDLKVAMNEKPLPPELTMVVGGVRPIDETGKGLDPRWTEKVRAFMAPDAKCLDESALKAGDYQYFFVDFTVNGEPVGAVTRVRCRKGQCHVAGVDN